MSSISLVSRRALLKACGALAGSGLGLEARAQPDPPPAGVAPYRPADDTLELLVVSDGHLVVPTRMLATNVLDGQLTAFLTGRGLGADRVHFHINVAVLRAGNEYVLIDAGAGGTWEPTAGRLADNLEAAGIALDAIGKVVITHAHPDHIWGLIDELDNSLRFPRAHYLVSAREFEFWTLGEAARLTGPVEGIAAGARRVFKAIEARLSRFRPGEEIAPGLIAIDTAGHTPGHVSLLLTRGPRQLLLTADALLNNHVAIAHPDWQPAADMDAARAVQSRRRLLDMAATDRLQVLAYHMPFPGLGRIERAGAGYTWLADA